MFCFTCFFQGSDALIVASVGLRNEDDLKFQSFNPPTIRAASLPQLINWVCTEVLLFFRFRNCSQSHLENETRSSVCLHADFDLPLLHNCSCVAC